MNRLEEQLIRAVAEDRVTAGTKALARRYLEKRERKAARGAADACTTAKVAKAAIASVEHHRKARRAEERELEDVAKETWLAVLARSTVDHRGRACCEACHRLPGVGRLGPLEPHHLELGAGGRPDELHLVMALCADCHRLDPDAAHRRPRHFAQTVVIPWARAHGYSLPSRKEYRE